MLGVYRSATCHSRQMLVHRTAVGFTSTADEVTQRNNGKARDSGKMSKFIMMDHRKDKQSEGSDD